MTVGTWQCEVCQRADRSTLFTVHHHDICSCRHCGHVFLAPEHLGEGLAGIYEDRFFADGAYSNYAGDKKVLQRNFRRFVDRVRQYSSGGTLLEVGCAYGFFLELARRYWNVRGIDIEPTSVASARERLGLDVECGDLAEMTLPPEAYDVVVMWDTIEHLTFPGRSLAKVADTLKPGGHLALTTGDVGSLVARVRGRRWRLYYPPYHVHYFSRRTLARLLERFGLEVVSVRAAGFNRSLDTMLYRMLVDRKGPRAAAIYGVAKKLGITRLSVYLNLFDIMFVVARKTGSAAPR